MVFRRRIVAATSLLVGFFGSYGVVWAQPSDSTQRAFDQYYDQAQQFLDAQLYAECADKLAKAIDVANQNQLERSYLDACITWAELKRKTYDFQEGLDTLHKLSLTYRYPEIHVRKLGRMAAIYHEHSFPDSFHKLDTVKRILGEALALARRERLVLQEGELLNELGYLQSRNGELNEAVRNLTRSTVILDSLNEERAYVWALNNLFEWQMWHGEPRTVDSLRDLLIEKVEGKKWRALKVEVYNRIRIYYALKKDTVTELRYALKAAFEHLEFEKGLNSMRMAAYRVVQETQKFQERAIRSEGEVERSKLDLEHQKSKARTLTVFLSIMGVLVLGILVLLLRERKLKTQMDHVNDKLQVANEKYHMLMVESNHRIKNNLQMIISMLEYATKDMDDTNSRTLKKMSSKIHTISALHKHLYADVHNEKVSLETYFQEIITLYTEMMSAGFVMHASIHPVEIRSERIIYFGLLLNEMLSNTLEHNKKKEKHVYIRIDSRTDGFLFDYRDDSIHESWGHKGMGMQLIKQLIDRVQGFDYSFNAQNGQYKFRFNA